MAVSKIDNGLQDQINDLNSKSTIQATKSGSAWVSGTITAYKVGNIVELKISNLTTSNITERTTLATIPSGYRPPTQTYGIPNFSNSGSFIIVESNGNIATDNTATGLYTTITYPAYQ